MSGGLEVAYFGNSRRGCGGGRGSHMFILYLVLTFWKNSADSCHVINLKGQVEKSQAVVLRWKREPSSKLLSPQASHLWGFWDGCLVAAPLAPCLGICWHSESRRTLVSADVSFPWVPPRRSCAHSHSDGSAHRSVKGAGLQCRKKQKGRFCGSRSKIKPTKCTRAGRKNWKKKIEQVPLKANGQV